MFVVFEVGKLQMLTFLNRTRKLSFCKVVQTKGSSFIGRYRSPNKRGFFLRALLCSNVFFCTSCILVSQSALCEKSMQLVQKKIMHRSARSVISPSTVKGSQSSSLFLEKLFALPQF